MKRAYLLFAGLALVLLGGCAEERPPIDRVQPYALKKSFFVGEDFQSTSDDPEFWTQGTLIDVGYGASQGQADLVSDIESELSEVIADTEADQSESTSEE